MKSEDLKPNKILRGPLFPEPVQVLIATPMGSAVKLIGISKQKVEETKAALRELGLSDDLTSM